MTVVGASKVHQTEPVEVEEAQPDYLNCVVELECGVSAVELLRYCQGVEAALGRERKGERAPRTVDIDVLLFGERVVEGPDLFVPHGGVTRAFNLKGSRTSTRASVFRGSASWASFSRGRTFTGYGSWR